MYADSTWTLASWLKPTTARLLDFLHPLHSDCFNDSIHIAFYSKIDVELITSTKCVHTLRIPMLNWIVLYSKDFSVCLILCIYNLCTEQQIGSGGGGKVHKRPLASVSIYMYSSSCSIVSNVKSPHPMPKWEEENE